MRPGNFIALRYLFAKKSHNVINIISVISVLGVTVGTAGLIIVLSVFNGFSGLVVSLYDAFDPDIRVGPVTGKTFLPASIDTAALRRIPGVRAFSWTLEENALLKFGDRQFIATIKGVDTAFISVSKVGTHIIDGTAELSRNGHPRAVMGSGVAWSLAVTPDDPFTPLVVYVPKKGKPVSIANPDEAFNAQTTSVSGVFSIQQDFDSKYVLVPLAFAQGITGSGDAVSSLEIALKPGADEVDVQNAVRGLLGPNLKAETRTEQHAMLYRILISEKWAVYFILSFILIIAVFNITGSLTMLIIEKKKDIAILRAMGAGDSLVRHIFLREGVLITAAGALAGLILGGLVCYAQQHFGLIKLEHSESFVIEYYPVEMQAADFGWVLLIVAVIGWAASAYTSARAVTSTSFSLLRDTK